MVVVLACGLAVVLVGFAFYGLRQPTVTTAAVETESKPASDRAALKRLRPPEFETTEASPDEEAESVDVPNKAAPGRNRRSSRVAERQGAADIDPEVAEKNKQRREKRRAEAEAKRLARQGPKTAADAIARLNSGEGPDAPPLIENWIPPGGNVLNELSPDLLDSLGLDIPRDAVSTRPKDTDISYRLVVLDYTYNSAARKAGIEPGDEIVSYFGEPVENVTELMALKDLAESFDSRRIAVVVKRNTGMHELEIRSGNLGVVVEGQ